MLTGKGWGWSQKPIFFIPIPRSWRTSSYLVTSFAVWQVASGDPHSLTSFSCLKYSYQSPQHPLSPARAPQRRPQGLTRSFGTHLPASTFGRRKGQNRTVRLSRPRCSSFQFGRKGSSKPVTPPLPSLVPLFLTFVLGVSVYTVKIRSSCGKGTRNWDWVRGGGCQELP